MTTRTAPDCAAGIGAGWHRHLDALDALLGGSRSHKARRNWNARYEELLPHYRHAAAQQTVPERDASCSARFTRRYDATIEDVWRALTDRESVARWLAPPPGVTVMRAEPERVLELDWSPPGEPPSVVRIELRAEGERTVLVLEHSRIDAVLGMRYMRDWFSAVERFDVELEHQRRQR